MPGWAPLPGDLSGVRGAQVALWPVRSPFDMNRAAAIAELVRNAGAEPVVVDVAAIAAPGEGLYDLLPDRAADVARLLEASTTTHDGVRAGVDMTLLRRVAAVAAPPTPWQLLPAWRAWLEGTAADVAAAPDSLLAALLSAPMGLVAGAVAVSPWPGYAEPVVGNVALVEPSGAGKTNALNAVVGPVRDLERAALDRHHSVVQAWQLEAQIAALRKEPKPPRPVSPQYISGDATPEAIAVRLSQRDVGLWSVIPEGAAFVAGLHRYDGARGSGGISGALAQHLEAFDAQRTSHTRRSLGDEPLFLRLAVSTLTGMQPDVAARLLAIDRELQVGLCARWLLVAPDPVLLAPRPQPEQEAQVQARREQWSRAAQRLVEFGQAAAADVARGRRWTMRLSASAAARFDDWRGRWRAYVFADAPASGPSGWDAKAPGWVLRLAGAATLLQWAAGDATPGPDLEVDLATIEAAIHARVVWARAHRLRVEADAQTPSDERLAEVLGRWVVATGARVVDTVALRRRVRLPGLRTERDVLAALRELQAGGFVERDIVLPIDLRRDPLPRLVPMRAAAIAAARAQFASAGAPPT